MNLETIVFSSSKDIENTTNAFQIQCNATLSEYQVRGKMKNEKYEDVDDIVKSFYFTWIYGWYETSKHTFETYNYRHYHSSLDCIYRRSNAENVTHVYMYISNSSIWQKTSHGNHTNSHAKKPTLVGVSVADAVGCNKWEYSTVWKLNYPVSNLLIDPILIKDLEPIFLNLSTDKTELELWIIDWM